MRAALAVLVVCLFASPAFAQSPDTWNGLPRPLSGRRRLLQHRLQHRPAPQRAGGRVRGSRFRERPGPRRGVTTPSGWKGPGGSQRHKLKASYVFEPGAHRPGARARLRLERRDLQRRPPARTLAAAAASSARTTVLRSSPRSLREIGPASAPATCGWMRASGPRASSTGRPGPSTRVATPAASPEPWADTPTHMGHREARGTRGLPLHQDLSGGRRSLGDRLAAGGRLLFLAQHRHRHGSSTTSTATTIGVLESKLDE